MRVVYKAEDVKLGRCAVPAPLTARFRKIVLTEKSAVLRQLGGVLRCAETESH
jgi:hypothetical protein